ncbi:MAG: dihydrolipoyl dehydrogenase [SAR324 cluster bacterium]|nr:dihydrolipoyl dehydrogenase [SAR324 cluster bacterium]
MQKFDVIVIGSGPGGYVTAIRASQLGKTTAIIEKYPVLGGTCLNVGCIPSKALLDSSEKYHEAKTKFSKHGINTTGLTLDWAKMLSRKDRVIATNNSGIDYLMKKNKVAVFKGAASFISKNQIKIKGSKDDTIITGKNIIIATGSKPSSIKGVTLDKKRIITSTEALSLKKMPKELLVIGGGVIGLELGSVYARLGVKVKVIEFFDRILANFDTSISKEMTSSLKKLGIEFYLSHKVLSANPIVNKKSDKVEVVALDAHDKKITFLADYCLVAVGRKANTSGLDLDKVGIETNPQGFIKVDKSLKTSIDGVFAIGDVIGGVMLAHKAEEEGVYVMERLVGQLPHINYELIPNVVYTWPEVASIGLTEKQCLDQGLSIKVGNFPFSALGRARASDDIEGFVKMIADAKSDEVLGVHIVGARASDLIMEVAVAMEYKASAEDIARTCHAHPTFSEAIKEAALATWNNQPLHL